MKTFTGTQYLMIDAANHYGLDKVPFEARLSFIERSLPNLEQMVPSAKDKVRFAKAVIAIRDAQAGNPSGHLVGLDASCSGIQLMSVLTGCYLGAAATSLVDPDQPMDAYSLTTHAMNEHLTADVEVSRDQAKDAVMTSFYGSEAKPRDIFGANSPQLAAFYKAVEAVAPGPWKLRNELLRAWDPSTKMHQWNLPDGFHARIKVVSRENKSIKVDELDGKSFTYQFVTNEPQAEGISLPANVIHSIDAYVVRFMERACHYDQQVHRDATTALIAYYNHKTAKGFPCQNLKAAIDRYEKTKMPDLAILPYLTPDNVAWLPKGLADKLADMLSVMANYEPFPLITIHDEFAAHPNNLNVVRMWYKRILAMLADADLLTAIFNDLGMKGYYQKETLNLSSYIMKSNYAIS